MRHFKVFFQGLDKNGVLLFKVLKYDLPKWNALLVMQDFEAKYGWRSVQINSWYEFTKSKRPKLQR